MVDLNPGSKWPVHPRDRFNEEDLGLSHSDIVTFDSLRDEERNIAIGRGAQELLHGSPEGVNRVAAIDTLHVLASKLGFELVPVERKDG